MSTTIYETEGRTEKVNEGSGVEYLPQQVSFTRFGSNKLQITIGGYPNMYVQLSASQVKDLIIKLIQEYLK